MAVLHAAASLVSAVIDLPLAHSIGYPHPEPVKSNSGGGASVVVIVAVIVVTVVLAGGLFWVRERVRRAEAAEAASGDETEPAAG
jgi:Na+/melibiose symporter-like transporter